MMTPPLHRSSTKEAETQRQKPTGELRLITDVAEALGEDPTLVRMALVDEYRSVPIELPLGDALRVVEAKLYPRTPH